MEIPAKKPSQSKVKPTNDVCIETFKLKEGNSSKTALIRKGLDPKWESALIYFLWAHHDIFMWNPVDMLGVPRELIEHSLNWTLKLLQRSSALHNCLRSEIDYQDRNY